MESSGFAAFGLGATLEHNLAALGLTTPTPIQQQAIPVLTEGRDLIATAPTGTGKTAAFLLPSIARLVEPPKSRAHGPRVLVLTPTRELAQQVSKAARDFTARMPKVKTVCITGGESYINQNRALSAPHEILVATPGRLMDQMRSGRIDFGRLEVLVLDEADRMLDMGFAEDVMAIAAQLPDSRQTVCFTATLARSVLEMSRQLQHDPLRIEVKQEVARVDAITQQVVFVDNFGHKRRLLSHWLSAETAGQVVIFTATKRDAEELATALDAEGHATVALHGDLVQRQRTRQLDRLRRGDARVLVATDVAARGIDVAGITHVFNFDLPKFAEDYVHRIGRTGRAGASGTAVSFVGREEVGLLRRIERFIGRRVDVTQVAGLEARFTPSERGHSERPAPGARRFDRAPGFGPRRESRPATPRDGVRQGERQGFRNHDSTARPLRSTDGPSAPRSRDGFAAPRTRDGSDAPRRGEGSGRSDRYPREFDTRGGERGPGAARPRRRFD